MYYDNHRELHSFPTRRSSDLIDEQHRPCHVARRLTRKIQSQRPKLMRLAESAHRYLGFDLLLQFGPFAEPAAVGRSEEHTSELQSQSNLVCRLLLEKKKAVNN